MRRLIIGTLCAGLMALGAGAAAAQTFPSRPVTVLVPFAPGGSTDIVARIVAQQLNAGYTTITENRTGGGGISGWNAAAKSPPDGHTILTTELSFTIAAGLIPSLPFDPRRDFTQVATVVSVPHVLVVAPSLEVASVQDFIAHAKANPGKLLYGSGGNGTNTHLAFELFKSVTGTDVMHIPYRGAGPVLQDLMAGRVQALITSLPTALQLIQSGRVKALMVTSQRRSEVLPDVPSAAEVGLPQLDVQFWVGFSVPSATPQPIVERLNRDIVATLALPDTVARFKELGFERVGNRPAEAAALVNAEIDRWSAVIRAAGIKAE
ncbi:MAG: tripartite tricarboxylate transporter substrate binding protein [Rhizobiales bacterium]|nr:tripartite tricarboxylate transporter substrate binding protein [Hyphomicrobiales bacterium]